MGEDVLSVTAKQIQTIQMALAARQHEVNFEGRQGLRLNNQLAIFVTMNPSSYGARSELPANMRSLFRPVNMMVPDYTTIAEVTLYSFGFENSHDLSAKICTFLEVAKSQLPLRSHYDFDMRALKTILQRAGALWQIAAQEMDRAHEEARHAQGMEGLLLMAKSHYHQAAANGARLTREQELDICRTALLQINAPKLSETDEQVFMGCLGDFFPAKPTEPNDSDKARCVSGGMLP